MRPRSAPAGRGGFAVPLAVLIVIALAFLTALMLDAAVAEFRSGEAWLSESRAAAAAETASAEALATRLDSAVLLVSAGTVVLRRVQTGADSVSTILQVLGPGLARLTVFATNGAGRLRAIAGRQIFVRMAPSPDTPGEVELRPLMGPAWVAIP